MDKYKIYAVGVALVSNGIFACYLSRAIQNGIIPWWASYLTSFISASIFAYQLKAKLMPLTLISVFQTFFFHAAWYATAFFILDSELKGIKIVGLLFAFVGMIMMSL
jgi:hypothetical protein